MSKSSARYWLDRCKELERLTDQGCRVTAAELAKLYDMALASIKERIQRLYGRFADGYGVTPGEVQKILSVAQTKQEREILRQMLEECDDPDLRAEMLRKLDAPAYAYRISRLEALQDQVYFDAKAVGMKEVKYDKGRLLDTYKTAYYRTTFNLSQSVGHNVPFEHISDRRAARAIEQYWTPDPETLGANFSQRVWGNVTQLAENVREIVTEGLMTGGNYRDMAAQLQAQMGDVGAAKVIQPDGSTRTVLTGSGAKYRATRLIRTEGNHITGQAVLESYEDAGIEKYIYRSLLELRTCKKCGKLDGKRFPVKEQQVGVNMHPMHPNCRCFTVPDEPDEMLSQFTRSAQTGADNWEEVPASMTWEEWRKKYVDKKSDGEPERITSKAEPLDQVKIDGWDNAETLKPEPEKKVENSVESGIMESVKTEEGAHVREIAKIDRAKYAPAANGSIRSEVLVLTERQKQHIIGRRGQAFFDTFSPHFKEIAEDPDYIFHDKKHPNTALASKTLSVDGKHINLVIRLAVEGDESGLENSVITAIVESDKRYAQRLRNNVPLYKKT